MIYRPSPAGQRHGRIAMKDNAARLARLKKEFAAFLKEIYPGREKVSVFGDSLLHF